MSLLLRCRLRGFNGMTAIHYWLCQAIRQRTYRGLCLFEAEACIRDALAIGQTASAELLVAGNQMAFKHERFQRRLTGAPLREQIVEDSELPLRSFLAVAMTAIDHQCFRQLIGAQQ